MQTQLPFQIDVKYVSDMRFVKIFTHPNFQGQKVYYPKVRKLHLISFTVKQHKCNNMSNVALSLVKVEQNLRNCSNQREKIRWVCVNLQKDW